MLKFAVVLWQKSAPEWWRVHGRGHDIMKGVYLTLCS